MYKTSQRYLSKILYIPWGGTRTLPQGCTIVSWLLLPCLCIPFLPWLSSVWNCPSKLRKVHGGWMKPILNEWRLFKNKMVTITLQARQKKRYRCIEQIFGLYERRRGGDDMREQHQNMYIIKCETDLQSGLDAWDKCLGLVHWEDPEGWDGEGSGRGFRMGNTCKPMADSCQCMAKTTANCKVISLQLIKINGKK